MHSINVRKPSTSSRVQAQRRGSQDTVSGTESERELEEEYPPAPTKDTLRTMRTWDCYHLY